MRIRFFILLALAPLLLDGCAAYRKMSRNEDCEKIIKNYNRMIRWQEAEKASIALVDKKQRPEYDKAAESMRRRGVTIADYRVLAQECLGEKKKAQSTVEFDYFIMPDNRMKTVTDRQSWILREENPAEPDLGEGWKLTSPFPDFK
jgi:hypothetical protein